MHLSYFVSLVSGQIVYEHQQCVCAGMCCKYRSHGSLSSKTVTFLPLAACRVFNLDHIGKSTSFTHCPMP